MLSFAEHTPRTHQKFWCNRCDAVTVDSVEPNTGTFYTIHGHSYSQESREYDGNYVGVMFALCPTCKAQA